MTATQPSPRMEIEITEVLRVSRQRMNPASKIGEIYGRLTIIGYDGYRSHDHYFNCECRCGKMRTVKYHNLNDGNTTSCGCSRSTVIGPRSKTRIQPTNNGDGLFSESLYTKGATEAVLRRRGIMPKLGRIVSIEVENIVRESAGNIRRTKKMRGEVVDVTERLFVVKEIDRPWNRHTCLRGTKWEVVI